MDHGRGGAYGQAHRPERQNYRADSYPARHRLPPRAQTRLRAWIRAWVRALAVQPRVDPLVYFLADALDETFGHGRVVPRAEITVRGRRGPDFILDAHAVSPARSCRHAIGGQQGKHWG